MAANQYNGEYFNILKTNNVDNRRYSVGFHLPITEGSNMFDRGFPYPTPRKKIPLDEIKRAFTSQHRIKLFCTFEEAKRYAEITHCHDAVEGSTAQAVYVIEVKDDSGKESKTQTIINRKNFRYTRDIEVTFTYDEIEYNSSNIKLLTATLLNYPKKYDFQCVEKQRCLVM